MRHPALRDEGFVRLAGERMSPCEIPFDIAPHWPFGRFRRSRHRSLSACHHFFAVRYFGIGRAVTLAYSTSESKSASLGQHTVPSSGFTLHLFEERRVLKWLEHTSELNELTHVDDPLQTIVERDAKVVVRERLHSNDILQHTSTPAARSASTAAAAGRASNPRAVPHDAPQPTPSRGRAHAGDSMPSRTAGDSIATIARCSEAVRDPLNRRE